MNRNFLIILFIGLMLQFPAYSDTRKDNIDVFILLDKSLSMENNINAVSDYINSFIVDRIIIPGDLLHIISFYGKTELLIDSTITDDLQKEKLKKTISSVRADGRFTDIGNALDQLASLVPGYEQNGRLKYMLLITDGKQEAPPESIYYTPDGSFTHKFLEHTKTIEQQGWKIHVLGIGRFTDAQTIAEKLSGTYSEINVDGAGEESIEQELLSETSDFLSIIRIISPPEIIFRGFIKKPYLVLQTQAEYLEGNPKIIKLSSVLINALPGTEFNLVDSIFETEFKEDGLKQVEIPLSVHSVIPSGNISGELHLVYSSNDIMTPSSFEVSFRNLSFIEKYLFPVLIALAVLIIILLAALRFIMIAAERNKKNIKSEIAFYCYVDGKKVQELPFILKNLENLYINFSPSGVINLTKQKIESSKAIITAKSGILSMELFDKSLLKEHKERFDNVLEKSFNFLKKNGKHLIVDFKRK